MDRCIMDDEHRQAIQERAIRTFLGLPGVHGVGIGQKETRGRCTGEPAVRIFLEHKRPRSQLAPSELFPRWFEGLPTDVVAERRPRLCVDGIWTVGASNGERAQLDKVRPLIGGTAISRKGLSGGTLGFFLTAADGRVFAVTNHHVLFAAGTDPFTNHETGQPEPKDSCTGCCRSTIGRVADLTNRDMIDVVLVQLDPGEKWKAEVRGVTGPIVGHHDISPSEITSQTFEVQKSGARTGLTGGIVWETVTLGTMNGRNYPGMLRIVAHNDSAHPQQGTSFIWPGDSGAALLTLDRKVAGLCVADSGLLSSGGLFGSAATNTLGNAVGYAIPIAQILATFAPQGSNPGIVLQVGTATSSGQVNTVVSSGVAPGARVPTPEELAVASRLELDLATPRGIWFREAYLRHVDEVNTLLASNRRVATMWHRQGGAGLFQSVARAFADPSRTVATEIEGKSIPEVLQSVDEIFERYGSPALRADLHKARGLVPEVAGRTYAEILRQLDTSAPI
jgi:hypothetical protein